MSVAVCGGPGRMQGCRVARAQGMNLPLCVRGWIITSKTFHTASAKAFQGQRFWVSKQPEQDAQR